MPLTTTTTSPLFVHESLATWSTDSSCSYNGQVLCISGSLSFDVDLLRDAQIALERGSIHGLVAPNGSGKTSLVRALPLLKGFPEESRFGYDYLSADLDVMDSAEHDSLTAKEYCLLRVQARIRKVDEQIDIYESKLETASAASLEEDSDMLAELYDMKDNLELEAESQADRYLEELQFGRYAQTQLQHLSSGWKYKCQLVASLLTRPACLVVDEPSFLDTKATAWFSEQMKHLAKSCNTMIVLISHKVALMEQLCDRILSLNPASKTLTVYHCSFRQFQAAHADRVNHAQRAKDQSDKGHQDAKQSLQQLQKQLKKREGTMKATTTENADKRWIKGKNKEAKQKADHSAASKVKRLQKKATEMADLEEQLRETIVVPLELEGADNSGTDRPIVELQDVEFRYDGSNDLLLDYLSAQIGGHDKIILHGANGQGKSTLAQIILGGLEPTKGTIRRHAGVVAHFHQEALSELIRTFGNTNALEFLQSSTDVATISLTEARTCLGRFGLTGPLALRPIRSLSAGQRVRLWLAREFWGSTRKKKPSLLVLDEVTENLDQETVDSLLECLVNFRAAVLAISHDDYFCQRFPTTQLWTLNHGYLRVQFTSADES